MQCRLGCGACCIAPSITSYIPGMPKGKAAGERCIQLDDGNLCKLFGTDARPKVCGDFKPDAEICGHNDGQALRVLTELEAATLRV